MNTILPIEYDGRSLTEKCREDPGWAANRIGELEFLLAEVTRERDLLDALLGARQ